MKPILLIALQSGGEYLAHKGIVVSIKDHRASVVLQVSIPVSPSSLKDVKCGMLNLRGGSVPARSRP